MNSQEYIKAKLIELVIRCPEIKVQYEWDSVAVTHRIKILPSKSYFENSTYLKIEEETLFEFIERFPNQNISFVTDKSSVELENICFEQTGKNYKSPTTVGIYNKAVAKPFLTFFPYVKFLDLDRELFPDFIPVFNSPHANIVQSKLNDYSAGVLVNFDYLDIHFILNDSVCIKTMSTNEQMTPSELVPGENKHALAA